MKDRNTNNILYSDFKMMLYSDSIKKLVKILNYISIKENIILYTYTLSTNNNFRVIYESLTIIKKLTGIHYNSPDLTR